MFQVYFDIIWEWSVILMLLYLNFLNEKLSDLKMCVEVDTQMWIL